MNKIMVSLLVTLLVVPVLHAQADTSNKIVAKVGNIAITEQDVDAQVNQMPPKYKSAYSTEEGRKKLIDRMTQEKLIYFQAEKEKYATRPDVIKDISRAKQNIMIGHFVSDNLSDVTTSEKEIKAYYDGHRSEFMGNPEVWAKHILCKTEKEAIAARDRVIKGESFEDVAKQVSTGPSNKNGGDLGWFDRKQMVPAFGQAAFELEKDGVSQPVQTRFGYHIIKVYGKKDAQVQSFEKVKPAIETKLSSPKKQKHMDELLNKLKQEYPVKIF